MDEQMSTTVGAQKPQERRKFLGMMVAGAGLAGGMAAGWHWLGATPPVAAKPAVLPTRDQFAQHLNSAFSVQNSSLQLVEVSAEKTQSAGTRTMKSFEIVFKGPLESKLEQQTCIFDHAVMGKIELFIVPVGKPKNGVVLYQAVFTQIV